MGRGDEWLELDGGLGWTATENTTHLLHVIKSLSWWEVRHRAGRAVAGSACGGDACLLQTGSLRRRCSRPLSLEQPEPIRSQVSNYSGGGTLVTVSLERRARWGWE